MVCRNVKNLLFCVFFLLLIFSFLVVPVVGDTFTGTESKTTATFTSNNFVKIVWTTTYDSPDYTLFSVYIYEQGNSIFKGSFSGLEGTTYYYDDGTLYFDVSAANLNSWTITTSDTSGEYSTSFSGFGSANTKLFTSSGNVKITWTTTYDSPDYAFFSVFTYEVGNSIFKDYFTGLSGETYFYEAGNFYFDVSAANLNSWSLIVEDLGGSQTTTDETSDTQTTADKTSDTQTNEITIGFEVISVLSVMSLIVTRVKVRTRRKK
ncbi:hypothetical protein CEE45_08570 [Candidatus Heimdallarchaeota archaeon B3_Heim]|nr:MAG: hypothetical protein CEE45_08570 [Candidatus Heimdallarchaeota archaeon B3_Heim]